LLDVLLLFFVAQVGLQVETHQSVFQAQRHPRASGFSRGTRDAPRRRLPKGELGSTNQVA
jgi:hypothetical protein